MDGERFRQIFMEEIKGVTPAEETKKPRVLVAEDNPSNYKLVEVLLRRYFELTHAWNGKEAVDLYREGGADLVLMDISMPVMDGYDALRGIREIDPAANVVALTAYAFEADRQRMFDAGFNDCMSKPVSPADFHLQVAAYIKS